MRRLSIVDFQLSMGRLMRWVAIVAALAVTLAGGALSTAIAPTNHACVQVASKDASDGQETHG